MRCPSLISLVACSTPTTVVWPESLSPFVTVARLRLPQQDIGGEDNFEKMDKTSMTAWRVTENAPEIVACAPR